MLIDCPVSLVYPILFLSTTRDTGKARVCVIVPAIRLAPRSQRHIEKAPRPMPAWRKPMERAVKLFQSSFNSCLRVPWQPGGLHSRLPVIRRSAESEMNRYSRTRACAVTVAPPRPLADSWSANAILTNPWRHCASRGNRRRPMGSYCAPDNGRLWKPQFVRLVPRCAIAFYLYSCRTSGVHGFRRIRHRRRSQPTARLRRLNVCDAARQLPRPWLWPG